MNTVRPPRTIGNPERDQPHVRHGPPPGAKRERESARARERNTERERKRVRERERERERGGEREAKREGGGIPASSTISQELHPRKALRGGI